MYDYTLTLGGLAVKVLLLTLNAKYIHSSLALRYLREYCRPVCADIVVKEYSINNGLLDILGDIYREKPGVIGMACYIWNIEMTLTLAGLIKKVLPDTAIVLGGPEVSYDPAEVMVSHAAVDYIVQGEGEETLYRLLCSLQSGKGVAQIEGLAYRHEGRVVVNGGPQIVHDLSCIPFPYSDEDMAQLADKIIYYESSRGCPFSCQYCLSSATTGVRFFPLERVYRDMEFFIRHDVKQVKFVDRTFNAKKEHYFPLWQFLARQNCRTNFHFEIAADILDDEVLAFLAQVPPGRFQFEIGVQSTYEPTLAEIKRRNDWSRIARNVLKLRSYANIHLHLDLIVGLPYETYERFGRSFNDLYALQPHMLQIGFLKLLKGSGIRQRAGQHGYVFMDTAPYQVLANNYLTYGEVRKLQILEEVFNQTYNSGRFPATLRWLVDCYSGDAFRLYGDLASYWEERGLNSFSHSAKSVFGYVAEFCRYHRLNDAICLQLLKFDALAGEGGVRPEFLPWNGDEWEQVKTRFWRDEATVRRYLPDYCFTSWREIKRNYHIEVFEINIPHYLAGGELREERTVILFCYAQDRINYQIVQPHDFGM
ncbi:Radical SAM superfamily enzyme YgiQ, UPF0313 family [Sporolituus thermophilus DSM 23256]|uniref:Radical SAM superfamily enzyme YgiQ, UPF0313 family n=1 Tax=Sporolituus thermophilus DSM 23256 TaxID=1123285 RepID=A0A1G7KJT1_9FIRM|nr:Radical SAM superfamily enzyme YgiQ, UPF0313 family [Sporolituus thermophilus DSM 23256]